MPRMEPATAVAISQRKNSRPRSYLSSKEILTTGCPAFSSRSIAASCSGSGSGACPKVIDAGRGHKGHLVSSLPSQRAQHVSESYTRVLLDGDAGTARSGHHFSVVKQSGYVHAHNGGGNHAEIRES